jgi:copper transport protein
VLPRRRPKELATVLPRFSTMATGAVGVLVAGGVVLSVELVGRPSALLTTGYGRVLVAKVAVVGAALAVATRTRRAVHAQLPDRSRLEPELVPAGHGRVRRKAGAAAAVADAEAAALSVGRAVARWVAVEVGFLAVVLAVSTVLLTRVPPS